MTAKPIVKSILAATTSPIRHYPIPRDRPYYQSLQSLPQPLSDCLQPEALLQCAKHRMGVPRLKEGIIGLVAAMPEELRPLMQKVGSFRTERVAGFNIHRFTMGRHDVRAVQSGMGLLNATAAVQALLEHCPPDLLINTGFAGGIAQGPVVGDVIVANRIFRYDRHLLEELPGIDQELTAQVVKLLLLIPRREFGTFGGTFVTTAGITSKSELAARLMPPSPGIAVVDMETSAVARVAAEHGIPFMAVRAISDAADEELGFTIEEITDSSLDIRIGKVLLTVARKPWIVPQLLRLAKNSRRAGTNLAVALKELLERL